MSPLEIHVPDIGTDEKVDVVEVLVAAGDEVAVDDGLVTLESDKASMDVPSTAAGTVAEVLVAVGDKVSEGSAIVRVAAGAAAEAPAAKPAESATSTSRAVHSWILPTRPDSQPRPCAQLRARSALPHRGRGPHRPGRAVPFQA